MMMMMMMMITFVIIVDTPRYQYIQFDTVDWNSDDLERILVR